jgi:putative endopeptidase
MNFFRILPLFLLFFVQFSCAPKKTTSVSSTTIPKAEINTAQTNQENNTMSNDKLEGIDIAKLSENVRAQDDFFKYVNEKWINENPIPESKSSWGMFHILRDNSSKEVKKIMDRVYAAKSAKGTNAQLLGDFYFSGMDTLKMEKEGVQPLKKYFEKIDNANNSISLAEIFAELGIIGVDLPIGISVSQDYKNAQQQVLWIATGGLGLPEKDYYFSKEPRTMQVRNAYVDYNAKLMELAGFTKAEAEKNAQLLLQMETSLAEVSYSKVEMRDPQKMYNPIQLSELKQKLTFIDLEVYLNKSGVNKVESLVAVNPAFNNKLNEIYKSFSNNDWKIFMKAQLLQTSAGTLSKAFRDASFDYNEKTLQGKKAQEPRWKKVIDAADFYLRDVIGEEYVKENFSSDAKTRALELVQNISVAFAERIKKIDWMSQATKEKALYKLDKIDVKIGYPDKWRTYSGLDISRTQTFFDNTMQCRKYEHFRNINKLGKPIDRGEWLMGPQTVNAYYNPSKNEIVFPAAILQPPFFSNNVDDALNYGGIGMVIGHEITHGFDDQGSQYDAEGNLQEWWSKEDKEKFKNKTQALVEQYAKYKVLDTLKVNGELTLGENIADLGGIMITYDAFLKSMMNKRLMKIDGLTPSQRFLINFGQIWRTHDRAQTALQKIKTDPHSPAVYRVNGVLVNFPSFYSDYELKPSDKMWVDENKRLTIW